MTSEGPIAQILHEVIFLGAPVPISNSDSFQNDVTTTCQWEDHQHRYRCTNVFKLLLYTSC
jgi:hypothetical protein